MFVAAVDVINAADFCDSIRFQPRQDKRGRGAQITRHNRRTKEMINALDHSGSTFHIDTCPHAFQFRDVHVALRENVLGDHTDAVSR